MSNKKDMVVVIAEERELSLTLKEHPLTSIHGSTYIPKEKITLVNKGDLYLEWKDTDGDIISLDYISSDIEDAIKLSLETNKDITLKSIHYVGDSLSESGGMIGYIYKCVVEIYLDSFVYKPEEKWVTIKNYLEYSHGDKVWSVMDTNGVIVNDEPRTLSEAMKIAKSIKEENRNGIVTILVTDETKEKIGSNIYELTIKDQI